MPAYIFSKERTKDTKVHIIKTPPCGLKPSGDRPNFALFVSFFENIGTVIM